MTDTFVTLFARNYAEKGLALFRSMEKHASRPFVLYALCMDEETRSLLRALGETRFKPLFWQDFETPDLLARCLDRDLREKCWTYAPVSVRAAFTHLFDLPPPWPMTHDIRVTYLDADTLFFADPKVALDAIGDAHATIVPHRFPERLRATHEMNGLYNVNFCSFRNTLEGLAVLKRWEKDCTDWCYYRVEDVNGKRRMGDQCYWDDYVREMAVTPIEHIGVGTAPWNMENYEYSVNALTGQVFMRERGTESWEPLVQFHYHEFSRARKGEYVFTYYPTTTTQQQLIYAPYVAAIEAAHEETAGFERARRPLMLAVLRDKIAAEHDRQWAHDVVAPSLLQRHSVLTVADLDSSLKQLADAPPKSFLDLHPEAAQLDLGQALAYNVAGALAAERERSVIVLGRFAHQVLRYWLEGEWGWRFVHEPNPSEADRRHRREHFDLVVVEELPVVEAGGGELKPEEAKALYFVWLCNAEPCLLPGGSIVASDAGQVYERFCDERGFVAEKMPLGLVRLKKKRPTKGES